MADEDQASEAARALVALRWAKIGKAERSEYGKMMVEARERKRAKRQSQSSTKPAQSKRAKSKK